MNLYDQNRMANEKKAKTYKSGKFAPNNSVK